MTAMHYKSGDFIVCDKDGNPLPPMDMGNGAVAIHAFAVDRNGVPIEDHLARIEEKLDRLLAAQGRP